jgi:hypothetical protein
LRHELPRPGRLGNDFEEREETLKNGETKTKLLKVGTKFKAGGGESFGYEPHLLLELSLERKNPESTARRGKAKAAWSTVPTCSRTEPGFERSDVQMDG